MKKLLKLLEKINSEEGVAAPKGLSMLKVIFPELKESDDERIRKELLDYLDERKVVETPTDTKVKEEWIEWLEKQNKPQVRTGIEWVNIIDDACNHRYAEEYAHGEYCHKQSFNWGFQEGVDWLEKQGEPQGDKKELIKHGQ